MSDGMHPCLKCCLDSFFPFSFFQFATRQLSKNHEQICPLQHRESTVAIKSSNFISSLLESHPMEIGTQKNSGGLINQSSVLFIRPCTYAYFFVKKLKLKTESKTNGPDPISQKFLSYE